MTTLAHVRVDPDEVRAELARREQARREHADPVGWGEARGLYAWSKQAAWLRATTVERQVAVPSGHGTGKSFGAAWRIAHHIATAPDPYVILTAPTSPQLGNVIRPLRELHERLRLPGYITKGSPIKWMIGDREVMQARSTSDTGQSTLAGPHAADLLVVVDEADGISASVWEQIEGMLTGARNRLLALGNPRDPASKWREMVEAGGWDVHHLSVLDTPAFTGEVVPESLKHVLPSVEWLDDRRLAWGEGTALWAARVLGQWPDAADNAILSLSLVEGSRREPDERAEDLHRHEDDRPLYVCDVAGDGEDRTVIGRILEREYTTLEAHQDWDTADAATRLGQLLRVHAGARVVVDCDGLGVGVRDQLRAAGLGDRVIEFKAGRQARRPDVHPNLRSEAWWSLRGTLGTVVRLCPTDKFAKELDGELTAVRYREDAQGRIAAEKKEETVKRLGRSPDLGDTVMMGVWGFATGAVRPRPRVVRVKHKALSTRW